MGEDSLCDQGCCWSLLGNRSIRFRLRESKT